MGTNEDKHVKVDPSKHKFLKSKAALEETTIKKLVTEAIDSYFDLDCEEGE